MGTNRRSVRTQIRSIENGLRKFQREVGDNVLWYELDQAVSTSDDTYSEGPLQEPATPNPDYGPFIDAFDNLTHQDGPDIIPGISGVSFKGPKVLPAIWIRFISPTHVQTDAGLYTVKHTTLRFATDAMRSAGLMAPQEPALHYGDRYAYKGALYRVEQYEPRGWLGGAFLMVDVTGRELKEEELEADTFPFWQTNQQSTSWTPGQQLNWPFTPPQDWED